MKKNLLIILSIFVFHSSQATTINVPADQATIQSAISIAASGDTILVQPGTYIENITWSVVNGIKLLSAGDSSNTIIDGHEGGRVLSFTSAAIDTNTVVKGFTITNGVSTQYPTGAGIYMNDASPLFIDCTVSKNTGTGARCYGAGIVLDNSHAVFRNCTVEKNASKTTGSYNHGGGFYVSGGSVLTMSNCDVRANVFDTCGWNYGAGIFVTASSINLSDVRVTNNKAANANYVMGNGIYLTGSTANLFNVHFSGNLADNASYNHGNGLYLTASSTATLDRVYITGNVMTNSGRNHGGGIYCDASTLNATNVLVADNVLSSGGSFYSGAGIFMRDSKGTLMNTTVAGNTRADAGTINGIGLFLTGADTVTITNSVFWNTSGGAEIAGTSTISYSDVNGGAAGTGNINSDPLFIGGGDYHISLGSPCEATGTTAGAPSYDIENNPRPFPAFTNPDMGAYEIGLGTGIAEAEKDGIKIYPNPTDGEFAIRSVQFAIKAIEIYNTLGEKVYSVFLNGVETQMINTKLEQGIYFVRVTSAEKTFTQKLIIQ